MTKQQKWAIVGAIWVAAIGIFLSAFKGRYERVEPKADHRVTKFDTWTGYTYVYLFAPNSGLRKWDRVDVESPCENDESICSRLSESER